MSASVEMPASVMDHVDVLLRQATALTAEMPEPKESRSFILGLAYAIAARDAGVDDADAIESIEAHQFDIAHVDLDKLPGAH